MTPDGNDLEETLHGERISGLLGDWTSSVKSIMTLGGKKEIPEKAEGGHVKSGITEGKKLIEERVREYAQESGIVIKEVGWYSIPGKVSHYVFMASVGGKPEECGFLAEELAGLVADSKSADKKLRALVNEIKKNGTYLPIQRHS